MGIGLIPPLFPIVPGALKNALQILICMRSKLWGLTLLGQTEVLAIFFRQANLTEHWGMIVG